jgi:hypothetical protein
MKIICPRKVLNEFRKKCRLAYPNETLAVLRGKRGDEGVEITDIVSIPHEGDEFEIKNYNIRKAKMAALRKGSDFVGTIHSHIWSPEVYTCGHMSRQDIKDALQSGETICGIVLVYKEGHRTEVSWYVPAPLPKVHLL